MDDSYVPVMNEEQLPPKYRPLSSWAYFGYSLLFITPLVGLICIIIFSFGGSTNVNLKNYARSFLCWLAAVVIAGILALTLGGRFLSIFN